MRRALPIVVAALLLAACSAPEQASRDFDEGPIKVGLLAPTSGTVAASGTDMKNGWELWFALNGDEVAGRTIETVHEDTAGDPTTALTKARRLVDQEGAKILAGPLLASAWRATSARAAGRARRRPTRPAPGPRSRGGSAW